MVIIIDRHIIGTIQDHNPKDDEIFAMGIGLPTVRKIDSGRESFRKRRGIYFS